jgi:hypothetical protein
LGTSGGRLRQRGATTGFPAPRCKTLEGSQSVAVTKGARTTPEGSHNVATGKEDLHDPERVAPYGKYFGSNSTPASSRNVVNSSRKVRLR